VLCVRCQSATGVALLNIKPDQLLACDDPLISNRTIAAALLRLAATTVGRTDTALGAFYRRLSSRIGKSKAVTATARKIAVLFYNALRHDMEYKDPGADHYDERYRARVVASLQRRARTLGYALEPICGSEAVS
jgi:transposase